MGNGWGELRPGHVQWVTIPPTHGLMGSSTMSWPECWLRTSLAHPASLALWLPWSENPSSGMGESRNPRLLLGKVRQVRQTRSSQCGPEP